MHLADAFIQRDLQCIQDSVYILSVYVFPGTRDLGFSQSFFHLSYLYISHHFSLYVHHLVSATGAHVVCAIGAQLQAESEACGKADVLLK